MGLKNEEGKMKVATRENSAILLEDDYEKKYAGFDPESEESYIIMSNYTSAYVIQSASLAMKIQDEYTKKAGRIDKGVHRQSIWVLWRTAMPSILTEIGYLTNPLEETFLGSEIGQDYLSKSIFRGLRKYKDDVEGTKKEYNDEIENQKPIENENIKAGNIPGQKKAEDDEDEDEDEKKEGVKVEIKKDEKEKVNDIKYVSGDIKDSLKSKEVTIDSIAT
jgi:N-acetylmuramoyl-L-alanine amidase